VHNRLTAGLARHLCEEQSYCSFNVCHASIRTKLQYKVVQAQPPTLWYDKTYGKWVPVLADKFSPLFVFRNGDHHHVMRRCHNCLRSDIKALLLALL
jgi:hypothetical protein